MRYLVNPMKSVHYHGKPATARQWAGSGFRRNAPKRPTKRQLAARRKFAAMARARASAARRHRASSEGTIMARRRRKAAHRRNPVRRGRARARSRRVRRYSLNPRRRVRRVHHRRPARRHYRRNPGLSMGRGILGMVTKVAIAGSGVALGRMAFNFANNSFGNSLVSATDTPNTQNVKRLGLGVGVGLALLFVGRKMRGTGGDLLTYAAAGAVSAPLMSLLNTAIAVPATFQPLGGTMAMPPFRQANGMIAGGRVALPAGTTGSYPRPGRAGVSSYPQVGSYPQYGQHQPN